MSKRSKTPSFVVEFEVKATSKDKHVIRSRREAARQICNAVTGEGLKRMERMKRDPAWAACKAMPRGANGDEATELEKSQHLARKQAFAAVRKKHGFEEFALHKLSSLATTSWLRRHLDGHTAQKMASRAFAAVNRYSYGQGGKPHFKRYGEVESVESKSKDSGIRYKAGCIIWDGAFAKLKLALLVKPGDQVHAHALKLANQGLVKYVRLLSRMIRGRERVFTQLVLQGAPCVKLDAKGKVRHPVATKISGGMDVGPSEVAVVTEQAVVETFPFCPELDRKQKELRRYQRRTDRQRRARNPQNYHEDGRIVKGKKTWRKPSKRQQEVQLKLAELQRAMAAQRKSLQGALSHLVLSLCGKVLVEKTSKTEWAKEHGRSIGHKAPGLFEARNLTLALAAGGTYEQINTYRTYLSSRCLCGLRKKKSRDERKHVCGCQYVPEGTYVDRDQFSAFLVLFASGSKLDEDQARKAWTEWGADCLLLASSSKVCGSRASGASSPTAHKPQEPQHSCASPKKKRGQSGLPEHGSELRRKNCHSPIRGRRASVGATSLKTRQPVSSSEQAGGPHG